MSRTNRAPAGILFWGGWETKRGEKFGHVRWHSPGEEFKPGGSRVREWGGKKLCDKAMYQLRPN